MLVQSITFLRDKGPNITTREDGPKYHFAFQTPDRVTFCRIFRPKRNTMYHFLPKIKTLDYLAIISDFSGRFSQLWYFGHYLWKLWYMGPFLRKRARGINPYLWLYNR